MDRLHHFFQTSSIRVFVLVWAGQQVSLVGSALTQFALGVWVFSVTGSPTQFVLTVLCAALPRILLAPIAGPLVDRSDMRRVLIASDLAATLVTLILMLLAITGALAVWHIYVATTLAAVAGTFQRPTAMASVSLLLPAEQYARASGLVALAPSLATLIAPAMAGVLYLHVGLSGVMLLDLASFLVAVVVLFAVRFPPIPADALQEREVPLLHSARAGWHWLVGQPGLFQLLLVSAAGNVLGITTEVLLTPYILSFAPVSLLGWLVSAGGAGLLGGSLLLTLWGGPHRLLRGVFGFEVVVCLATIVIGLTRTPWLLAISVMAYCAAISLADGCSTALWQRSVPVALQGRVFALREAIAFAALPLGLVGTTTLAELVFEPRLQPGGAWAAGVGTLVGAGPGRGIALVFLAAGLVNLMVLLVGWASQHIRALEGELAPQHHG
jgi:DHA3 family macrolide efflux protein-like MFS transporter